MRYIFFDTSALVKAYVPEPGSDRVRDVLHSAGWSRQLFEPAAFGLT